MQAMLVTIVQPVLVFWSDPHAHPQPLWPSLIVLSPMGTQANRADEPVSGCLADSPSCSRSHAHGLTDTSTLTEWRWHTRTSGHRHPHKYIHWSFSGFLREKLVGIDTDTGRAEALSSQQLECIEVKIQATLKTIRLQTTAQLLTTRVILCTWHNTVHLFPAELLPTHLQVIMTHWVNLIDFLSFYPKGLWLITTMWR